MKAGFIQIGDEYFATIKRGSVEEILKRDDGSRMPFGSATSATAEALKRIRPAHLESPERLPFDHDQPEMVKEFHRRRLAEKDEAHRMAQLLGVTVVRKRRAGADAETKRGRNRAPERSPRRK